MRSCTVTLPPRSIGGLSLCRVIKLIYEILMQ